MTPQQRELIDHQHAQKYQDSCAASVCEMLLKLAAAIPPDSCDLQDAYPNGVDGVSKFVGTVLPGDHTIKALPQRHAWEFPLAAVKTKLNAGIPVAIFLNPAHAPAHGWLVDDIRQNSAGEEEILLVSKYSERGSGEGKITATKAITVGDAATMKWSDPVYLEKLPPSPAANL